MLRRFEMYSIRPDVPESTTRDFERALLEAGRYIPELLHSVVGWNRSEAGISLVWEHAFDDPASYERYMRHPYHVCVLDRFLLPDAPDLVLGRDPLKLGLLGYRTQKPDFLLERGVRRVVALRFAGGADAREREAAIETLRGAASASSPLSLSVVGENSMGAEWFPDAWSHVWEQGFESEEALRDFLGGDSPAAVAERAWRSGERALVAESVDVFYAVDPDRASVRPEGRRSRGCCT